MNEFTPDAFFFVLCVLFMALGFFTCRAGQRTARESVITCAVFVGLCLVLQERYPDLNSTVMMKPICLVLIVVTGLKLFLEQCAVPEENDQRDEDE
jgi:cell division protein FtsW (lipid II flippase)